MSGNDCPVSGLWTEPCASTLTRGVVLCVSGVFGGVAGPCHGDGHSDLSTKHGVFNGLARVLPTRGWGVLQLEFRHIGQDHFSECLEDVVEAIDWAHDWMGAKDAKGTQLLLLGYSLGGALVVAATAQRPTRVSNVCTLAAQTKGLPHPDDMKSFVRRCEVAARRFKGVPLPLVIHGTQDKVLCSTCTTAVARRLGAPGRVAVMHVAGTGHKLEEKKRKVAVEVLRWVTHHECVAAAHVQPQQEKPPARRTSKQCHGAPKGGVDATALMPEVFPSSPTLSPPRRKRVLLRAGVVPGTARDDDPHVSLATDTAKDNDLHVQLASLQDLAGLPPDADAGRDAHTASVA